MLSLSLMTLMGLPRAFAAPDRVASEIEEAASTAILSLAVDADQRWGLVLTPDGLRALNLVTWEVELVSICDSPAGLATWTADSGDLHVFVGCGSGEVERVVLTQDGSVDTAQAETVSVADGEIMGLAVVSDSLWVVADGADGTEVLSVAVEDLSDVELGPSALSQDAVVDVDPLGSYVLVLHGNDDISRVDTTTANSSLSQENLPGRNFQDMAVWGSAGVFLADEQGALVRYVLSGTNTYQLLLDDEDGLGSVDAVAVEPTGTWLALADSAVGSVLFFPFDTSNLAVEDTTLEEVSLDAADAPQLLAALDDYLLCATSDGRLLVMTELPWVRFVDLPSTNLAEGDMVPLTFESDTAGDWELRYGSPTGDLLDSGSIEADGQASSTITIDDTYVDGRNRLYLVVDTTRGEAVTGVDLIVDNPPGEVTIVSVGFSDGEILLELQGDGSADLARFDIYISTEAFTAEDWPSGGPAYSGPDSDISNPTEVEVTDPEESVSVTLSGLTNDQLYYLGVRAIDEADTEGPMSDVFTATPTPVLGAADLAGESGGLCGVRPGAPGALLGLLALGLLRGRRVGALALLLLPLAAPLAQAGEIPDDPVKGHNQDGEDLRVARTNEVRLGPMDLDDENIATVYGTRGMYQLELQSGVQVFRVLEFDAGLGLTRRQGYLVSSTGETSTEIGKITLLPLSLSGTARLDIFDGQPIVPYASFGLDYWLWRERLGTPSLEELFVMDAVGGGKGGYHYALGANLLLDWMDKDRADLARARWGIYDTYLVAEWRQNKLFSSDGLIFDGSVITVGIKVDR